MLCLVGVWLDCIALVAFFCAVSFAMTFCTGTIKHWAQMRGVYGAVVGYPGTLAYPLGLAVHWAGAAE